MAASEDKPMKNQTNLVWAAAFIALATGLVLSSSAIAKSELKTAVSSDTLAVTEGLEGPASKSQFHFASLPQNLAIPVELSQSMKAQLRAGEFVEAMTRLDVTLPNGDILPAGTRLTGHVNRLSNSPQGPVGSLSFDTMHLSSGRHFPIEARVQPLALDRTTASDRLTVRLGRRAQIAVNGSIL